MPILSVVVLAVVQGLSEYLPISSKTHLLFARHFLGMEPDLFFDVVLHGGSLLAVLVYYHRAWRELLGPRRNEVPKLLLGTLPIVAAGLLLKDHVEHLYTRLVLASAILIVTGAFLFLADRAGRETHDLRELPWWKVLLIGLAQACAILPGVSRSGSTIGTGYLCGLKRADSVRFSFFLGAVAILGALVLKTRDAVAAQAAVEAGPILVGISVTFGVSLAAIRVVEMLSNKGRFSAFAIYCATAGSLGLAYFLSRG